MSDILSLVQFIINNKDKSINIIVLLLVIAFYVFIARFKKELWIHVIHKRNIWKFFVLTFFLVITMFFHNYQLLIGGWFYFVLFLICLYVCVYIQSIKPIIFCDFRVFELKKYEKFLQNGLAFEYIDYFKKSNYRYLYSIENKIEFHMLASMYFSDITENGESINELDKIQNDWLYKEEIEAINNKRAIILTQIGNMKAANHLLGNPDENKSSDPMVWFAYSFIYENLGDIDKALEYAEKSRSIVDAGYKAQDYLIAQIYNNYSRVAVFKGNRQEALHYLNIAWNKIKNSEDKRIIHIIAQNRIMQMAIIGKDKHECEDALKEYQQYIPCDSIKNKLEYNNCLINYYRQIKDANTEFATIKANYTEMIDHLDLKQKINFKTSVFRMLINGHFDFRWFTKELQYKDWDYNQLSLIDKLNTFKEYMAIFQDEVFCVICNESPYHELEKNIINYYRTSAISDIDKALEKINPSNINLYNFFLNQKLWILKILEGKEHINNSKYIYIQHYHFLYDAGLHLDAIRVLVSLIEECSSTTNLLVIDPLKNVKFYYSDYVASVKHLLKQPQLAPDKIHFQYSLITIPDYLILQPLKIEIMREYIDTVINEYNKWKYHPYKIEISIFIADVLMKLNRKEEAKHFFLFFKNSNTSEMQMSAWMQFTINMLENNL